MISRLTTLALVIVGSMPVNAQLGEFTWVEHPTLTWDDFKGRPLKFAPKPDAETDSGLTGIKFVCNKNGMLDVNVEARFNPAGSWVRATAKTAALLKHEQGHFDITELYARKLRKAIRDAKINCEDKAKAEAAGRKIVDQLEKDYEAAETKYDTDTKDGTDATAQSAASNMIANDLAALSAYKQ